MHGHGAMMSSVIVRLGLGLSLLVAAVAAPTAAKPWSVSTTQADDPAWRGPAGVPRDDRLPEATGDVVAVKIAGVELVDDPQALDALEILLGSPDAANIGGRLPPGCRTAECAADVIFGRGAGTRLLFILQRFGYNASPFATRAAQPWTAAQLDEIISIFETVPRSLFDGARARARPLILVATPPATEAVIELGNGDDGIRLASIWSILERPARRGVLLHELAHNLLTEMAGRSRSEAMPASFLEWAAITAKGERISQYASRSPAEDFAETFVAYLRTPVDLRAVSAERFEFMRRQVFRDAPVREAGARVQLVDASTTDGAPTTDAVSAPLRSVF
jgi:hypothetical protein